MKKRLTKEEFVEKTQLVHGDKYDYSLVEYKNIKTKIKIICKIHGIFEQIPEQHLNGCGCSTCRNILMQQKNSFTKEEFIEKANKIHNNKYDYSNIIYVNNTTKINIICHIHGLFKQTPSHHLSGGNCQECANLSGIKLKTHTFNRFLDEAHKTHGNKYDYSKVNYTNLSAKITIICPIHGEFTQTPLKHKLGNGCKLCVESKGERIIRRLFENNNINYIPQKKFDDCIGIRKKLPFDFYLPEKNIAIEFNGKQHYEPIKYFGGKEAYNRLIFTDAIKLKFCKVQNIKLLIIKYNNIDNIETIFKNEKII